MPNGKTCPELAAINTEAREMQQGLAFVGSDEVTVTMMSEEHAKKRDSHKATCPKCNPAVDETETECTWVDTKMAEYKEIKTGLLMGYADHDNAKTVGLQTLDEIKDHIDGCLSCRKAFRKHLPEFLP